MAKSLQEWKNKVLSGAPIDLDNQSYDCVDVSKHWVEYLTGVGWKTSAGWGNAKDIYYNWSSKYLEQIPRGNAPKLGDIIVMNGTIGGGYGHTAVIIEIRGNDVVVVQQDTFKQVRPYTGVWGAYQSYVTGFLRPKVAFTTGAAAALLGYQREVAAGGVYYREEPKRTGAVIQLFPAGDVLDFKGYITGENVDGNDKWLVGMHTGKYAWSGGFTDTGLRNLSDLTPATMQPHQRQVGGDLINYRTTPTLAPDNVIKQFNPGEVLDFNGWTRGTMVDGIDIWFRGKYTGGYAWAGGFTNQTKAGLTEIVSSPAPSTPTPTTPAPSLTGKVIDISSHNKVTDYAQVIGAVAGVIAKAGHTGISYGGIQPINADPTFATHKANLGGKLLGAYWYGYPSLDPRTEAQNFVTAVGEVPSSFTYWLDIENFDRQSAEQVNQWCRAFCEETDNRTKKVTGLYMNRNWYTNTITSETKGTRPIWLAHYGTAEMSNPVPNQVAHQYSETGSVPGIEGGVDLNAVTAAFTVPTVIHSPTTPTDPQPTPTDPIPSTPLPADPEDKWPPVDQIRAVVTRAAKTFAQAFVATITVGWTGITDADAATALLVAAIAAGISAAWNTIKPPTETKPPVEKVN